jgi:hypothetical protein
VVVAIRILHPTWVRINYIREISVAMNMKIVVWDVMPLVWKGGTNVSRKLRPSIVRLGNCCSDVKTWLHISASEDRSLYRFMFAVASSVTGIHDHIMNPQNVWNLVNYDVSFLEWQMALRYEIMSIFMTDNFHWVIDIGQSIKTLHRVRIKGSERISEHVSHRQLCNFFVIF